MVSFHIASMMVGIFIGMLAGGFLAMMSVFFVEEKYEQKSARINFSKGWDYGYEHGVEDTEKELKQDG